MYELKNWCLVGGSDEKPFQDPYLTPKLYGEVYGHPNFLDGTEVTTSAIRNLTLEPDDSIVVETDNSRYLIKMDTVFQEYEEVYKSVFEKMKKQCSTKFE